MGARALMFAMGASLLMGMPAVGFAQDDPKTDPAATILADSCNACHDASMVEAKHLTRDEWDHLVDDMVGKGAILSTEDHPKLVDYLVKYWGPAADAAAAPPAADAAAAPSAAPSATPPAQ